MERRSLLKAMALGLGYFSLPPAVRKAIAAAGADLGRGQACWVTPEETAGPFYFDPQLLRVDIREDRLGVPLDMAIAVIDENCIPQPGVLVDVWHCDKDGCYSGYSQVTCDAVGETFLRGTQITDASGLVNFTTIYPGWYPGRCTHVHFKCRSAEADYKISQFAFPDAVNAEVYASPLYAGHGQNPTSNAEDGIFGGQAEPLHQLMDVTGSPESGYTGSFTVGLEAGTTEVGLGAGEALGLVAWPVAFRSRTTLRATLAAAGAFSLSLHDAQGRFVRRLARGERGTGSFEIAWDGRDERGRSVAAGVYLATLASAGLQVSTRVLRLK